MRNKATGEIELLNAKTGDETSFDADRNVDPQRYEVLGVFHTHPFDAADDNYSSVPHSFSDGDFAAFIQHGDRLDIVRSGTREFMLGRTDATPGKAKESMYGEYQQRLQDNLARTSDGDFEEGLRMAAAEMAAKYGIAYYENESGAFVKVKP